MTEEEVLEDIEHIVGKEEAAKIVAEAISPQSKVVVLLYRALNSSYDSRSKASLITEAIGLIKKNWRENG